MQNYERLMASSGLLRTFLTVVESGNVTHAAAALGRTQSTVSVQIRQLEETLSVKLFRRQSRGVELTEQGRRLLPAAQKAMAEMERLGSLFDTPLRGRIRVGIPDDYDETVLERVLAAFAQRHPRVEVYARSGCTSRFDDAVRQGALDLAVCSGPEFRSQEVLSTESNVWVKGEALELDAGAPVPLAILDRDCWWRTIPTDALDRAGRKWTIAYSSESFSSLKAAIRAGLAIGVVPESALESTMVELGEEDGFPILPVSRRAIIVGKKVPEELVAAMIEAIRHAVPRSAQKRRRQV